MVFFGCEQKGFFSSAVDYIFKILFPRTADCPLTDARLASLKTVCRTRFTPNPAHCDGNVFRTAFTAVDRASSDHFDPDVFETSFTPTPCPRVETFATGFYPEGLDMAYRRSQQACRKKEYDYDQKPFFNAVTSSEGTFSSPGIVQSLKSWYCGGRSPPPMPSIVDEPDDDDCNCRAGSPLLARLVQLQRWLMCSPVARGLLTLVAARGVLYLLGVRVCFVKMV